MKAIAFAILLLVAGGTGALAGTLIQTEARGLGSDSLPILGQVPRVRP